MAVQKGRFMNNIKSIVKKTIKEMDGVELPSIERYLKKQGYTVLYIGTPGADEEIRRYFLEDYAKDKKTFTYCGAAKFVFVPKENHPATKQILLLHELGHILLGHIGAGRSMYIETTECEAEADAFAYAVIKGFRNKERRRNIVFDFTSGKMLLCMLVSFSIGASVSGACSFYYFKTNKPASVVVNTQRTKQIPEIPAKTLTSAEEPQKEEPQKEETVYISKSGECFHLESCSYKGSNPIPVDKKKASLTYRPCRRCNP